MKKAKKPLRLNKTTLYNLNDSELTVVVGGDPSCPGGTGPCPTNGPPGIRHNVF